LTSMRTSPNTIRGNGFVRTESRRGWNCQRSPHCCRGVAQTVTPTMIGQTTQKTIAGAQTSACSGENKSPAKTFRPTNTTRNLTNNRTIFLLSAILALLSSVSIGQEIVNDWRYTLRRPAAGWRKANFDDADWKKGFGGLGPLGTPRSRVGTTWATDNIWLRKSFELS